MYSDSWETDKYTLITDEIYRRLNKYDGDKSAALKIVLSSLKRELLISDFDIYVDGEIGIKFFDSVVYYRFKIDLNISKHENINILRCVL